ncbi:MAG: hypothetical protein NC899_02365, partial [Candidatus Omnitrophica bacterium]|nr:hypothetical protein [Candidatus Omnitrophota bacterium]
MKKIFLLFLLFNLTKNVLTQNDKIYLGIPQVDGDKYNVEFRKYHRTIPLYQKNNIEPILFNDVFLPRYKLTEEQIYEKISRFHLIHLTTTDEGIGTKFGESEREYAKRVSNALKRFVEEGGGLFIQVRSVRYPNEKDEEYWNQVLKIFGIEILHEGVYDKTREYEGRTLNQAKFFYTQNIKPHILTEGIKCLYLPLHDYYPGPGVVALKYSSEWEILIKGEKEAKSYKSGISGNPNVINLEAEGTYKEEPPIFATRKFGKGRIVSYPISPLFTGANYLNPLWESIVEEKGDPLSGRKSDSWQLQMNSYRYLGENAKKAGKIATYKIEPYKRITFPNEISWDKYSFSKSYVRPENGWEVEIGKMSDKVIKGIVGVHTAYTDGEGKVKDYVEEAKKLGLSFIVFTEPLEFLTPEEFESLKKECQEISDTNFYACPGIEFTDGVGIRWIMLGERIKYPPEKFISKNYEYIQWDGEKINHYGQYFYYCGFPQTGIIDYKKLREVGGYPHNLWYFFMYIPYAYDKDKLIADNYNEFLFGLRDLRWNSVISYTKIKSPKDLKVAAEKCVTIFKNLESVKKSLNARASPYWFAKEGQQHVSQGPIILQWESINDQMENNYEFTRGAQRVRLKFEVFSNKGIKEVKVRDANYGIIRNFIGKGEKLLSKEFEIVHDKQHFLTLEVIDNENKKAISHTILIYCYKQGLFRCSDNLNILGPLGFYWHPDRNEMLPLGKGFRNGNKFALTGWDTADPSLGVPNPRDLPLEFIRVKGIGEYPSVYNEYTKDKFAGKLMDVKLASYNLQIVSMLISHLVPMHDRPNRPPAVMASLPLNQGELEFFERSHTMIAPADRVDFFVQWNYRRYYESIEKYEGSLVWHEGEIRIKKDIELEGNVPIPLLFLSTPVDFEKGWGDTLIVKEPYKTRIVKLNNKFTKENVNGKIKEGGYISWQPTVLGYTAVFIPKSEDQTEWSYAGLLSKEGRIYIGLGENGKKLKKGDVLKYSFLYGIFAEKRPGIDELENIVKIFNLEGGKEGYPIKIEKGRFLDGTFFFTAEAENNEALFTLGPQNMIIDLPIRVKGIEDNGCAAIYSTVRPWFRFVSVYNDTAYFQEPIEKENKIWVGNIFVSQDKNLKITVVVDGQDKSKPPFIEIH